MAITAALVKQLRERTGAGMMECKKALVETGGDLEAAVELMRKAGLAKADKKAGRVAAEGRIAQALAEDRRLGVLVEVNCETDFVGRGEDFVAFAEAVARTALGLARQGGLSVEALLAAPLAEGEETVDERRRALVAKVGENITVRRAAALEAPLVAGYSHGGRIGVLVGLEGGDEALGRDIAMHVAASRPVAVSAEDVPAEVLAKEREIFEAQARASGKPEEIVARMVEGRLQKFLKEVTLLGQPFVKDPERTVGQLLEERGARVTGFLRLEVGEGIEKEEADFAAEVMAQVKGA
ncbi:MAG: elongation factor Ts [Gammaproteobacteria bacterium]|nr:MAG: elongation factor Ts [Gammaproteobacteria bacterium]